MKNEPEGPIAQPETAKQPVTIDTKSLLTIALGQDAQAAMHQQPGQVQVIDLRHIIYGETKRRKPGKEGDPDIPNRVTLGVPDDVLLSLRGDKEPKLYVLLAVVPAALAGQIAARQASSIVTPEQDLRERQMRPQGLVRP